MRSATRFVFYLSSLLLGAVLWQIAQPVSAATSLDLYPTYRQDKFAWNKAGMNGAPNIISELNWDNLRIQGVKAVLTHDLGRRHFLEASGSWGWIYAGTNQDSDYDGNDRSLEFSRSNNNAGGGTVFDASLAIGWKLSHTKASRTNLLLGYAINRQSMTMTDYVQTVSTDGGSLGPMPGINTAYMALWRGPWLGLAHESRPQPRLRLSSRLEFHLPDYNGECHWNARKDLDHPVSNNHWAKGQGVVAALGVDYQAGPRWSLGAGLDYTRYWIRPGTDQVNAFEGSKLQIELKEVRWDSWALRLNATYVF